MFSHWITFLPFWQSPECNLFPLTQPVEDIKCHHITMYFFQYEFALYFKILCTKVHNKGPFVSPDRSLFDLQNQQNVTCWLGIYLNIHIIKTRHCHIHVSLQFSIYRCQMFLTCYFTQQLYWWNDEISFRGINYEMMRCMKTPYFYT